MTVRLYLLRHADVESHRGDVPITPDGETRAVAVGHRLAQREPTPIRVLSGDTKRTMDTAAHIALGMRQADADVADPPIAFALRNPDLYLGGVRVDLVSTAETFAGQVDDISPADVAAHPFFAPYLRSPDRIGHWLEHPDPPGETAVMVAGRFRAFAASLADGSGGASRAVVAVTHSPLIRAVALDLCGKDIGEPPFVSGLLLEVRPGGAISADLFGAEET